MFIVWGTRIKRRSVGRVADFCTVCHEYRPFRLVRVGAAGHVYGLSFGGGRLVAHERVCEICDTPVETPFERYTAVSKDKAADLETLVRETHPALAEQTVARLALEERARNGQATPEERHDLLLEPFLLVNPLVEEQQQQGRLSPQGRTAGAAAVFLFVALMVVMGMSTPERNYEKAGAVVATLFAASLVVLLFHWATSMRSFIRREIEPRLVRALGPFNPSPEELESIVSHLKDGGLATGRKLRAHKLRAAFATTALTPGRNRAA